jgi:sugar/nucleoside kinase (ribokinase family)
VIVVIGNLVGRSDGSKTTTPAGFAAAVALAAAERGSTVEVVTRLGDDVVGDAVLLGLARAGIGHVATLRDAGRRTPLVTVSDDAETPVDDGEPGRADRGSKGDTTLEAADVGLALRYLSDYRVIVIAHLGERDVVEEAVSAAGWAGAHLVIVTAPDAPLAVPVPASTLILAADADAEATAIRVGTYAAAIDAGGEPDTAFAVLTGANAES